MSRTLLLALLFPFLVSGQVDFTSSHLPIIKIDYVAAAIPADDKILANLDIIYGEPNGENKLSDPGNEYSGFCGIELRGESSLNFDKKSYSIELWNELGEDIQAAFLNFPEEEDFVLHGPYSDKTLVNNAVAMKIARELGQYASRTRFVEVVINSEYQGLYLMMEKIKKDKNRVAISKLAPDEITGDDLTGGYIIRIDHNDGDGGWESDYDKYLGEEPVFFQYFYPKGDQIVPEQEQYIQTYIADFEEAIAASDYRNKQGKHFTKYIEIRSFIDNFIINELTKNVDAYRLSSYFHKDKESKGGKLTAGPIWDYNLSMANAGYCNCRNPDGWMYYQCTGESPMWWDRLFNNFLFSTTLKCRWEALRENELATNKVHSYVDAYVNEIGPAASRNFQRWPVMGQYIWPNSDITSTFASHPEAIDFLKNWLTRRLTWMDNNIPGTALNCALFDTPNFEIQDLSSTTENETPNFRIFPNPATDQIFINSKEQIKSISLINAQGQKVWQQATTDQYELRLDLSQVPSTGLHMVVIRTKEGVFSERFFLNE